MAQPGENVGCLILDEFTDDASEHSGANREEREARLAPAPPERALTMPTTAIDVQQLPSRFNEIVSLAASGTEVIVTEHNVPRARLIPLTPGQARIPGLHAGMWTISDDFDAPLPEDFWTGSP